MTPRRRIEHLTSLLEATLPGCTVSADAPTRPSGSWFVDVKVGRRSLVVELRPKLGFGLSSTPAAGYGEGADEFFPEAEAVVQRIAALVRSGKRTRPQRVRLLKALREQRKVSQVAVASKLGVRQPTVSKLERREDVALGTLRRYVEALGGELHITAEFSDETVEIAM